ncbi:MAG TPA: lysozyme inhibitor LprI family protein [Sphingopyxis sp.]|nr:lysozyme inhibitor LprI family protein [Sphingopyxis sp.]
MILATLMTLAAAAQEPELDCDNAMAQFELNACAYKEYERADAAMNAQWKVTAARMKEIDADFDRSQDNRPGYFDTLLAAQRAWLTYREQHCAGEGYTMRGGSAEPMVISGCQTQLTEARTKQLKDLIEEY